MLVEHFPHLFVQQFNEESKSKRTDLCHCCVYPILLDIPIHTHTQHKTKRNPNDCLTHPNLRLMELKRLETMGACLFIGPCNVGVPWRLSFFASFLWMFLLLYSSPMLQVSRMLKVGTLYNGIWDTADEPGNASFFLSR